MRMAVELSGWRYLNVKSGARAFHSMGSRLVSAWIVVDSSWIAMSSKAMVVLIVWRRAPMASCCERRAVEAVGRRVGRVEMSESACNVILVIF